MATTKVPGKAAAKAARGRAAAPKPSADDSAQDVPLSPRELRRLQRIQLSREQILDVAEQLFGERGYHATGLKEVAELCEFSVGSLYSFFDSKDDLYRAVLRRRFAGHWATMQDCATGGGPAIDRLVAVARGQLEYLRRYPAWGRLIMRVLRPGIMLPSGGPETEFGEGFRRATELEADLIAAGQRDGSIRAGNPRALARLFSAWVTAFHVMDPAVTEEGEDVNIDDFLAMVRETFGTRPTS